MKKKGVFCIWGGSFRNSYNSYESFTKNNILEKQFVASQSQINFLKSLLSEIDICLIIITYKNEFSDFLFSWYKDFNPLIILIEKPIGFIKLSKKVPQLVSRYGSDFYFFIRIDLVLKSKLLDIIHFPEKKIVCPFICYIGGHEHIVSPFPSHLPQYKKNIIPSEKTRSRPSDLIMYVCSKFKSELASSKIWLNHDFTLHINYDIYKQIDYYIDTFHDSNTSGDRNPLFYICNRNEELMWKSEFFCHTGDGQPEMNYEKNFNKIFVKDYPLI